MSRFNAVPSVYLLLAQDVGTRTGIGEPLMRRHYPKTFAYLKQFEALLRKRAAYKRYQGDAPFYSMYDIDRYTLAPTKVVWRRMDRQVNAAVVEETTDPFLGRRPSIPQETCVLIETQTGDEAHYLCAVLNSAIVNLLVKSHSVRGGKGFGTPSMLDYLSVRRFNRSLSEHKQLVALSRKAHELASQEQDFATIQRGIDEIAASLWGVAKSDLAEIIHGD